MTAEMRKYLKEQVHAAQKKKYLLFRRMDARQIYVGRGK